MKLPIYLDSHATTPCDPRVVEAMLPAFTQIFGNAASRDHVFGWQAQALVDKAREQVASLINGSPHEIIFTSGATESDNLAIKGLAHALAAKGRHLVTCLTEHRAVLDSCRRLEREGFEVTYLPVQSDGRISLNELEEALREETILVSLMFANNEIGTLQPIGEVGRLCKEKGIFFHCDATQAMAYERVDVQEMGIDLLSLSAHKMYGPKGIGALYVRRRGPRVNLEPLIDGGGHERGLRSGTLNVPGIVGLGRAAELVLEQRESDAARIRVLRDRLLHKFTAQLSDFVIHGSLRHRLPNNLSLSFARAESAAMFGEMKELALSAGAACSSASLEPSHVLLALGVSEELAESSLRIGLHRFTTQEEIDYAADLIVKTVLRLRGGPMLTKEIVKDRGKNAAEWSK